MNLNEERKLWKRGYRYVAGVDEVGRGALAGPVFAAAVLLLTRRPNLPLALFLSEAKCKNNARGRLGGSLRNIKDSKQLTAARREQWYDILTNHPGITWSVALVSEKIIDKIGIDRATWLAMEKAVLKLKIYPVRSPRQRRGRRPGRLTSNGAMPDFLLIDGNRFSSYKLPATTYKLIVKGDEKVFSIAAASVIAKVTRDRLMTKLSQQYPRYGFWKHKGYGTREHVEAIKKHGARKVHRKSFSMV